MYVSLLSEAKGQLTDSEQSFLAFWLSSLLLHQVFTPLKFADLGD